MECRGFQVTLLSAQNLENVRKIFRNDVRIQAKVSLGGNTRTEKRTPEDKEGQTNPVWNFTATYTIGKDEVKSQDIKLLIQLYCARTARDTNIGEVSVSLKELFDRFSTLPQGEGTAKVSYPVKKGGADSQGEVSFSYKFGDIFVFVPPSIDWGKLCWLGTKFLFKGGVLCIRLTLLASGNVFDVPIDAVADIALTAYDILSQIFSSGGDLMVDIPWEEIDLPVPGADVPMAVDTTSSLQTNVCEGSNVPADSTNDGVQMAMDATSVVQTNPFGGSNVCADSTNDGVQMAMDATSVVQTNPFGGSNVCADSTNLYAESNVSTDTANAGTNLPMDVLHIPSDRREAPVDVTSCVETNVPADVPFSGADVPMVVDATSCEVSMDATFSTETNVAGDISCLKAVVRVDVTSSDETNAGSDVSFLNADVGVDATFSSKTNLIGDISCLEVDAWEDAWKDATFNGEARDDISYLEGDFGVDDTFNGEINVTDDISGLEADAWGDATFKGKTTDAISCLEGDVGVDDAFGCEINVTNRSSLNAYVEEDATFTDEMMDDISWLEGNVEVDDTSSGETDATAYVSGLVSSARDLVNFLRAKLHLIIILLLLMLLVFFLLLNVVVY